MKKIPPFTVELVAVRFFFSLLLSRQLNWVWNVKVSDRVTRTLYHKICVGKAQQAS